MTGLFAGVDMAKVLMGQRAFQIPLNMIVQRVSEDGHSVSGVFQTTCGLPLLCGSARTHVLLCGDMIYRPQLALGSDEFRGYGFAALAETGFIEQDKWIQGDTILPPL